MQTRSQSMWRRGARAIGPVAAIVALVLTLVAAQARGDDVVNAREVDRLIRDSGRPATRDRAFARLRTLGPKALPVILDRLTDREAVTRVLAINCLQVCWAQEAEQPVADRLSDPDANVRELAAFLLRQRVADGARLAELAGPACDDPNPAIAGPAIATVLAKQPSVDRMTQALANRRLWPYVAEQLPRYQTPQFSPATRNMLASRDKAHALRALIFQLDESAATRKAVTRLLISRDPTVRDLAGEYMRWHGRPDDLPALTHRVEHEPDPYVRASFEAAVAAVKDRAQRFADADSPDQTDWPEDPVRASAAAAADLRRHPSASLRMAALSLLRQQSAVEPVHVYRGRHEGDPPRDVRIALLRAVFGLDGVGQAARHPRAAEPVVADEFMPPVADYFDPERKSYGLATRAGGSPFANSHHAGDDVAWWRDSTTVVAVADGVVREAAAGQPSWGGLVIIEHRLSETQSVCSLYAHLGPLVCVRPGQSVQRGQKIGTIGRSLTWENGGYQSHLHFSIHSGPYQQAQRWVTGYVRNQRWTANDHGWLDPQVFLKEHRRAAPANHPAAQ